MSKHIFSNISISRLSHVGVSAYDLGNGVLVHPPDLSQGFGAIPHHKYKLKRDGPKCRQASKTLFMCRSTSRCGMYLVRLFI